MNDWATRRKTLYLTAFVLILSSSAFFIFWKFWYTAPTCSDNIQNGDETGIDCGGSCSLICAGDATSPIIRFDPRLFESMKGIWSSLVYVENPNSDANAYIRYTLTVYDETGTVISTTTGATVLPKQKVTGVFDGDISLGDKIPKKSLFEITDLRWKRDAEPYPEIDISHTPILNESSNPKVEADIINKSFGDLKNIEFVIAIFDGTDNVIGTSRSFVENLKKDEAQKLYFTWVTPFDLPDKFCEKDSNVVIAIDRSGSMASQKKNPPEPLTSVKNSASSFVKSLHSDDKVSILSFATSASEPKDLLLTNDLGKATSTINSINILKTGEQYTNIFDAIRSSWEELSSNRVNQGNKVAIILTDGVANYPQDPAGKTEADNITYAEGAALTEAGRAKKDGINIFTIGLGKEINEFFLKSVASGDANFYLSPTVQDLDGIYKKISSSICKEVPARIEITYKVLQPESFDR